MVRTADGVQGTPLLADDGRGVAYFGHGDPHGIFDDLGRALFAGDEVKVLEGRWVHAFACLSAHHFGPRVQATGATRFVGYTLRLPANWSEEELPGEVLPMAREAVSAVTLALAAGRPPEEVREGLRLAVEAVNLWFLDHPEHDEEVGPFLTFCQQLLGGLRVIPTA